MAGSDLKRRKPSREPKARFLVFCEGKTEQRYLEQIRHLWRCNLRIEGEACATPKTLVEKAAKKKRAATRLAKQDPSEAFQQVWCVFDIDEHPYIPESKDQAKANGIRVAISNPCFELWALLHFQDQSAHIERGPLQSLCRELMPGYRKQLPIDALDPLYRDARERAAALDEWQRRQGRVDFPNPSTGVHLLMEELWRLSR